MAELFADALKFGGAVMIRRIVGIAHIDDFKDIQDEGVRYAVLPCPSLLTVIQAAAASTCTDCTCTDALILNRLYMRACLPFLFWMRLGLDWVICRGVCEARALQFGRRMLLEPIESVQCVVQEADKQRHDGKKPCHDLS